MAPSVCLEHLSERRESRFHLATVLTHCGIDADDTDLVVSAAAVGLVAVAWRDGPLETIREADGGPSDGEVFAQSVDLCRRARAALLNAREDGPEALLAFQAVASDVDLPWAGGSSFTLRGSGEPVVASAMERLAVLDRSDAPDPLADLAVVEATLREAPDRLGAAALDWLVGRSPLG
ncbi:MULTISPECIES: hypothetical protein [unclassified Streptomyces]|uniref:hypothetical protein n=1 Tax=unclassified Streptomyces TaxID=2593676 RepID=UPI0033B95E95